MNEFERRLAARQDELDWLYMELYDDRPRLEELKAMMARPGARRAGSGRRTRTGSAPAGCWASPCTRACLPGPSGAWRSGWAISRSRESPTCTSCPF